MRYLMVSTYPPTHCGIGGYCEQNVALLRSQGHIVDLVSPDGQGNVDFAWDLRGGTKILHLLELLPFYDAVMIQYHWAFFYRDYCSQEFRLDAPKTILSFLYLFLRSRKIHVVAHEIPHLDGRLKWQFGQQWRRVHLIFHTKKERERLEQHYGYRLRVGMVPIRQQHEVFQPFTAHTQASARQELGIDADGRLFLCIGFTQRHKGFHRAIQAFVQAGAPNAYLFVVGSLRVADGENRRYLAELREMAAVASNIHDIESYP